MINTYILCKCADATKPNMLPLIRKYDFHMILAGHRFGKSGQKRHASRAHQLALQVCTFSATLYRRGFSL